MKTPKRGLTETDLMSDREFLDIIDQTKRTIKENTILITTVLDPMVTTRKNTVKSKIHDIETLRNAKKTHIDSDSFRFSWNETSYAMDIPKLIELGILKKEE